MLISKEEKLFSFDDDVFSGFLIDDEGFRWEWCSHCNCAFVRCAKCQMNACSPCYGILDNGEKCDFCPISHEHQYKYDSEGKTPKKEQLLNMDKLKLQKEKIERQFDYLIHCYMEATGERWPLLENFSKSDFQKYNEHVH